MNRIRLSDLILQEYDSGTAYTRDAASVTPPATGKYKCGTLVFRAKGLDPAAPYALATDADLVAENEFAILIGDHFQYESEIELLPVEAGKPNAVVLARGNAILASWVLEEVGKQNGLVEADFPKAYALLANQGIIVEKTYGIRPTI